MTTETKWVSNSSHQCQRYLRLWPVNGKKRGIKRLAVIWAKDELTLEYTDGSTPYFSGGYRLVNFEISDDLKTLVGLFVVGQVPAGVLADRLQDERPDMDFYADFLRLWEQTTHRRACEKTD